MKQGSTGKQSASERLKIGFLIGHQHNQTPFFNEATQQDLSIHKQVNINTKISDEPVRKKDKNTIWCSVLLYCQADLNRDLRNPAIIRAHAVPRRQMEAVKLDQRSSIEEANTYLT